MVLSPLARFARSAFVSPGSGFGSMLQFASPMASHTPLMQRSANGYFASFCKSAALNVASGRGVNTWFIACISRMPRGSASAPPNGRTGCMALGQSDGFTSAMVDPGAS